MVKRERVEGHLEYLEAMGIQAWQRRDLPVAAAEQEVAAVAEPVTAAVSEAVAPALPSEPSALQVSEQTPPAVNESAVEPAALQTSPSVEAVLRVESTPVSSVAPAITPEVSKQKTPPDFSAEPPPISEIPPAVEPDYMMEAVPMPTSDMPPEAPPPWLDDVPPAFEEAKEIILEWPELEQTVKNCTRCELSQTRTQAVFGVGNRQADWLIIGEAPGADEDRLGEPFVGRAGKLLDQMLFAIGLDRKTAYIANILKCRPPNNRDPKPEEARCCEAYLKNQIALIKPKVILAVGRVAAQNLLKTDERIGAMRGRKFEYDNTGVPVVVTYHPAYLLRSPMEKRKSWQDLLLAKQVMAEQS